MGSFANNAITDRGRVLLAEIQAGALLDATRIVMGSGFLASGVNPHNITAVVSPVKSLDINKKERTPDGKAIFGTVYTNRDVTEPFYFRELALYARPLWLAEDGTVDKEGDEVLYSYGNAGSAADLMPAYSTNTVVEKQIDLVTWVGNDVDIALTIESGIAVSEKRLADCLKDKADLDPVTGKVLADQLPAIPALFGPVTVDVPASGWTGSGPWVQTVAVSGVTAEDIGLGVYPVDVADAAARKRYEKAYGCLAPEAETGADSVTLTCRAGKPEIDFQVVVKGVR